MNQLTAQKQSSTSSAGPDGYVDCRTASGFFAGLVQIYGPPKNLTYEGQVLKWLASCPIREGEAMLVFFDLVCKTHPSQYKVFPDSYILQKVMDDNWTDIKRAMDKQVELSWTSTVCLPDPTLLDKAKMLAEKVKGSGPISGEIKFNKVD